MTVHQVPSPALGAARRVWRYDSPGTPSGPRDLLVLLDGDAWGPVLSVRHTLDNLYADGRVGPLTALLVDSVDEPTRWREMAWNPAFRDFLRDELPSWAAESGPPPTTDPARTVIAGQSLGGLTALWTALADPGRFGGVVASSASLWLAEDGTTGMDPSAVLRAAAPGAAGRVRVHLSVGLQEWVLLPLHRELAGRLPLARYVEYNGGHDFACWRGMLADGLADLLGPGGHKPEASRPPSGSE